MTLIACFFLDDTTNIPVKLLYSVPMELVSDGEYFISDETADREPSERVLILFLVALSLFGAFIR